MLTYRNETWQEEDVIHAIPLKHQNGEEDLMELEHCAMRVVYVSKMDAFGV